MTEIPYSRSPELLSRAASRLLVVDVQEKLLPAIPVADELIGGCRTLVEAAQTLDIPVLATEQYPRGLGATTPQLADLLDEIPEKLRFSCAECLPLTEHSERYQWVVCGIEAHVCVLQTVFDLLAAGQQVFVAADAVASRRKRDWKFALRRMSDGGATIITLESALFEWCEVAGTDEFKQISRLVKERK